MTKRISGMLLAIGCLAGLLAPTTGSIASTFSRVAASDASRVFFSPPFFGSAETESRRRLARRFASSSSPSVPSPWMIVTLS